MSINITIPTIPAQMYEDLEASTNQQFEAEASALKAIREKFAKASKHGQRIKIAFYDVTDPGQRRYITEEDFLRGLDGKLLKGWELIDGWEKRREGNAGAVVGSGLFLTERGWVELIYTGQWSNYQGSPTWWAAGGEVPMFEGGDKGGGSYAFVTDEYVAQEYELEDVLTGLSKAIEVSKDRVPKRIANAHEAIALATKVTQALS